MFLDRKQYNIDIASTDTVSDIIDKIKTASDGKIQASVDENGKFSIAAYKNIGAEGEENWVVDTDRELTLGTSADTSNLVSALKMHTKTGTYGYTSSYAISTVNTDKAMASIDSGLDKVNFYNPEDGSETDSGKITINGVDFEINKSTSLNNLISRINGTADTHVKASYDSLTNKLILTSTARSTPST